jgi:RNase H-fold protein (predicted Holliday junction resolvase)
MTGLRATNPILGIDFGRARIGTAISDELLLLAHPLETIPANERAAARVVEIV